MKVKDVMTRGIEGIQMADTVLRAAMRMKELDVGALAVFDGNRLIGMITDRDIVVRVVAGSMNPGQCSTGEVMTRQPVTCDEDTDLSEAVQIMETNKKRRLLVRNEKGEISGLLSIDDIAERGEGELVPEVIRQVKEHVGPKR